MAGWGPVRVALTFGLASRAFLLLALVLQWPSWSRSRGAAQILCRWDCIWYVGIADSGYGTPPNAEGQSSQAFFPALPLLMRVLDAITMVGPVTAGVILSSVSFLLGLALLHDHCRSRMSARGALFVAAAMACSPFSIYFLSPLTEGLFFLLGMLVLREIDRRNWMLAALAGGVMAATRATGLIAVVLILGGMWRAGVLTASWRKTTAVVAIASSGLFAHMAQLAIVVGDPFAFVSAQVAWHRSPRLALEGLLAAVRLESLTRIYLALCLLVAVLAVILLLRYREGSMAVLLMANVAVPAVTALGSLQRYALAGAPLYVTLGHLTERRPGLRPSLLILLLATSWWFARGWLAGSVLTM